MAGIRRSDTQPERALRSALHRMGYRFRKDFPIRLQGKLIRPDVAFTRRRIAVFVDGCFWHCCPEHGRVPAVNGDYWSPKLAANIKRDRQQDVLLRSAGWTVVRFWEHEDIYAVTQTILDLLEQHCDSRECRSLSSHR
jgi:DNA mismatch endonuclease (patch repair protein)